MININAKEALVVLAALKFREKSTVLAMTFSGMDREACEKELKGIAVLINRIEKVLHE